MPHSDSLTGWDSGGLSERCAVTLSGMWSRPLAYSFGRSLEALS